MLNTLPEAIKIWCSDMFTQFVPFAWSSSNHANSGSSTACVIDTTLPPHIIRSCLLVCFEHGVYVFHVCFDLCWGLWCSLCCWMLFVTCAWMLFVVLLCSVVGVWGVVIFVLSVMRVVGGVILADIYVLNPY